MTLRLIGAGVGRTGTLSLKIGLRRLLGGPGYHRARDLRRLRGARAQGGYAPLCQVLGLPLPAELFPHLNTTQELRSRSGQT